MQNMQENHEIQILLISVYFCQIKKYSDMTIVEKNMTGHFNDLRSYNSLTGSHEWTSLDGQMTGLRPPNRTRSRLATAGSGLFVFGGRSPDGLFLA
jgi:hypothetical protein